MGFNLDQWKKEIAVKLPGWQEGIIVSGYDTAYYFLAAVALIPVVRAFQRNDNQAVYTLALLLSDTGDPGLLTNLVSRFVDKSTVEIAQILQTEAVKLPGVKIEIDVLLRDLEVIQQASQVLPEKQKHWFRQIVRREQAILNNKIKPPIRKPYKPTNFPLKLN